MAFLSQMKLRFFLGKAWKKASVQAFSRIDSTNLRMKEQARKGLLSAPALILAQEQTAGRGRLGRTFVSPRGTGLYMSLLIRPDEHFEPGRFTVLAAVAVCRAIEELTPLRPRIKWVNDLFLRGKKICGILAEGAGECAVVGIGVNLLTPPGGFPPEAGIAGALDVKIHREKLCARIAHHFYQGLKDPSVLDDYRNRMLLTGKEISYLENGQEKNARVLGVDDQGGLIVENEEGKTVLRCGEVTLGSYSFSGLE